MRDKFLTTVMLLLITNSSFASWCSRTEWNTEPEEYEVIKNCEITECDNYSKWDLLYFSVEMFGYEKPNNFYDIKDEKYISNHCLAKIKGKRSGILNSRSGEEKITEKIDNVALINIACPKVGEKIIGNIIYQTKPPFEYSTCSRRQKTGRLYLKVKGANNGL